MSKRPEHVRCENCCYWRESEHKPPFGYCMRMPPNVLAQKVSDDWSTVKSGWWCGEFRAEWPEDTDKALISFMRREFVAGDSLVRGEFAYLHSDGYIYKRPEKMKENPFPGLLDEDGQLHSFIRGPMDQP